MNMNKLFLLSLTLLATVSPALGMESNKNEIEKIEDIGQCPVVSPMYRMVDYGALLSNITSLYWLIKNDGLFGNKRLKFNSSNDPRIKAIIASGFFSRLSLAMNSISTCEKNPALIVPVATGITDIVLLLNWAYHSVPKEHWGNLISLIAKKPINLDQFHNKECLICHDEFTAKSEIINPCDTSDHLYCKSCLESWYNKSNNYTCLYCTKPIESTAVEIKRKTPNIKQVGYETMGFLGLWILVDIFLLYQLLSYSMD